MLVYVLNKHRELLIPCKARRVRSLLKQGKAKVVRRCPFTIQLLFGSSGYRQAVKYLDSLSSIKLTLKVTSTSLKVE